MACFDLMHNCSLRVPFRASFLRPDRVASLVCAAVRCSARVHARVRVFRASVRVAWLRFQDNATTRNGLVRCRCHADAIIARDNMIFLDPEFVRIGSECFALAKLI